MTSFRVAFVDLYPLRHGPAGLETLALRRSRQGRCPGAWEVVHGRIEEGESPVEAALRELREETGLAPACLYNLSRVESFYRHAADEVGFIPVFAAFVADAAVQLSDEHDACDWLSLPAARGRLAWPRERRALDDIQILLGRGDAGPLEDVLRVC
ncbi:MAG: NUDIX domain-containing protein [Gemmatimonadota bacterium]|nr:NUDIX domain-containing protein [Gemmatimonadota bacterium]MDH4349150.1 NUDIX domain-containing protein [Gemmatimonadota bacterium]